MRREVVVSAGALGSPHLLLLSGIGPSKHLKQHNVRHWSLLWQYLQKLWLYQQHCLRKSVFCLSVFPFSSCLSNWNHIYIHSKPTTVGGYSYKRRHTRSYSSAGEDGEALAWCRTEPTWPRVSQRPELDPSACREKLSATSALNYQWCHTVHRK